MKCPRWLLSVDADLPSLIQLNISETDLGFKKFKLHFSEGFCHFKYVQGEVYTLSYLDVSKRVIKTSNGALLESELIIIKDNTDDIIYKAKASFASLSLTIGKDYRFRYLGLDASYNPRFVQDEKSFFLKPINILSESFLKFIKQEHLVNNDLKKILLSQIENKDNFWTITLTRYLAEIITAYIDRNRFEDARLASEIFTQMVGFIKSKKFFSKIPVSVADKIKPNFEIAIVKVNHSIDFLDFQSQYNFDDLFKPEISFTVDAQVKILKSLLELNKISLQSLGLFKTILFNLKDNNEEENISYVINNVLPYFRHKIVAFFIENYTKKYFSNFQDRLDWLDENEIDTVVELSNFFQKHTTEESFHDICSISLLTFIANLKPNENISKKVSLFLNTLNIRNPEGSKNKLPEVNKRKITIYQRPTEVNHKCGFIIQSNKFIYISSKDTHLINYLIQRDGYVVCEIIANIDDTLFLCNFNLSDNERETIFEKTAIIKAYNSKDDCYFVTYGIDNNNFHLDSILEHPYSTFYNRDKYRIGDIINLQIIYRADHNNRVVITPDFDNRFGFNNYNEDLTGIINHVFKSSKRKKCNLCRSYDISYNKNFMYDKCKTCKSVFLSGAEIYLPELQKIVYVTESSFKNLHDPGFFKDLRRGDEYVFRFNRPFNFDIIDENKDKLLPHDLQMVESINFVENQRPNSNKFFEYSERTFIVACFFNLINDLILTERAVKNKKSLTDLNLSLGYVIKTPKTYLLQFLGYYDNLIESIKTKSDLSAQINNLKELINRDYIQTSELFPKLIKLFKSIDIIEEIGSQNYEKQLGLLNNTSGVNHKLIKLILINNLVESEDKGSGLTDIVFNQIIEMIQVRRDDISFSISSNHNEVLVSEDHQLLIDINNKYSGEGQNLEFKETFICPVLDNEERKKIDLFKNQIEKSHPDSENFKSQIKKIEKGKISTRNHKNIHKELAYSTIKNICAFLNSNDGKVIVGIRDDNSLIGLNSDFEVLNGDFDDFSRKFEDYWKDFVEDSAIFRPYVSIKPVIYEDKTFCFIDVNYPHEIKEPCFVKKPGEQQPKCIVKNSSTTEYIYGKTLRNWKRKPVSQTKEPNYVYLMTDKDGFYKIGLAKDPQKRQGTLMSQDKKIKLIKSYIFPSRELAQNLEKHLHRKYKHLLTETKGEWFKLTDIEIEEIDHEMSLQMEVHPVKKLEKSLSLKL